MIKRLCCAALVLMTFASSRVLAQTEQVTYFHIDAVGSVRMTTDASGQVTARYDYLPFGGDWPDPPSGQESRRFAAKEHDQVTGFDYLGARYYASGNGRFTTPDDPSYMDPFDPQSMNRYAYVYNNPLRYVDPTGHSGDCVGGYDSKTGLCQPELDSGLLRFILDSWFRPWGTAAQQVAQPVTNFLTAPRDPACMETFMMGGAAAGAAFGGGVGVITGPGEVATVPVGALTGAVRGGVVGLGACMSSAGGGGGGGGFKSPKPGVSGKGGAKDVPSWAKGQRPRVGESGKDFAKRLLDGKYGPDNYDKGPGSEFSQIQKWGDRAFQ